MARKPLDYSKWDHIEISDDEDDQHPNIDTASLNRWRHQARLERMEETKREKEKFKESYSSYQKKKIELQNKLKESDSVENALDLEKLRLEMSELEKQEEEFRKKEEDLKKKERTTPWNVDTICHDGKSKTIINKDEPRKKEILTDEERADRQINFSQKYEKIIKKFGMLQKYEDSQQFLSDHPELVCEETANYLVIWCINLEVEEKHELMNHVAHQTIVMQFILELSKQLDIDPRNCVRAFFSRIKLAEKQYMDAFNDELSSFKSRIEARAQAKIEQAMKEVEEEERKKRLGPGGLDPVEVFETLPKILQTCFETKDVAMLQKAVEEMSREDAEYHLKRCVDSGLWVPGGAENGAQNEEDDATYETVDK